MLAGTPLGAIFGTVGLGLSAGQAGRRLAIAHVLVGLCMSAIAFVGVPLWALAAERLVAGQPETIVYGTMVLRPAMAAHLGTAFVLGQATAALACLPLRRVIDTISLRVSPSHTLTTYDPPIDDAEAALVRVLCACRSAVLSLGEVVATRERQPAVEAEKAIAQARSAVTALLSSLEQRSSETPINLATLTACLHLATATDGALRVAERALELDLTTDEQGTTHLARVQALLVEGMEALVGHAEGRTRLSLAEVQAREIRLNALEAEARATAGDASNLSNRLWLSELSSACESIGNHIYRLGAALATAPSPAQAEAE
jgi:hypothetical protein